MMPRTLTKQQAERAWDDNQKLVYSRVWHYVRLTGRSFEDLVGPAHEAFMHTLVKHDAARGAFSTLLYRKVTNSILDWLRKEPARAMEETVHAVTHLTPADHVAFHDALQHASDDAQMVARIVLEAPRRTLGALSHDARKGRQIRGAIRQRLRKSGWSNKRISRVYDELKLIAEGK